MTKVVAIHQPNFFPWLGYFDKIVRSDVFIFFDDVQFPKKGGSWSNRVKFLIGSQSKWVTASIERNYSGFRNINEMNFQEDNWRIKMLKTLKTNYSKNPFYAETMEVVEPLILNSEKNVAEYNINTVTTLSNILGLDIAKFKRSSEYNERKHSNKLLCSLTKKVGGDIYMCGGGADGYQDETVFMKEEIELVYQNFQNCTYPQYQKENYTSGLSIIDAAMNVGWPGVRVLLANPKC